MKKIGNRPNTEADTDFSKLQKNEIKNKKIKKNPKNFRKIFRIFFPPFFTLFLFSFLQRSMWLLFLLHESNEFNVH